MSYSIRYFRVAVKFLSTFRLDLYEVAEVLKGLGYYITAPLPPRSFKLSAGGSGPVAVKEGVTVDISSDRGVIGVSSSEPERCVKEFMIIEDAVKSRIGALRDVHFYELLAEIEVKGSRDPMKFMRNVYRGNAITEEISKALGEPLFAFGYRLAREGTSPEDCEWVDIEVMPTVIRPHTSLYIAMVYRSKNREKVINMSKKIMSIIKAVGELMESGRSQ